MDAIYECALNYNYLMKFKYRFVVASGRRKTEEINLEFKEDDFYHIAGMQHLHDISDKIKKHNCLMKVLNNEISDKLLRQSSFYKGEKTEFDIESRIERLRYLEEYLDNDNYIYIYNIRNQIHGSKISADYVISSKLKNSNEIVYIFLRKRKENPQNYVVISFFKKVNITYGGDKLYWMLKEKICGEKSEVIYIHPNFQKF